MAKKIKPIKCPQCGSNEIKEIKEDYYQCAACKTHFFLDTDAININHNYNYPKSSGFDFTKYKKEFLVGGTILVFLIFVKIVSLVFGSNDSKINREEHIVTEVEKITEAKKPVYFNEYKQLVLDNVDGSSVFVTVGDVKENWYDKSEGKIYVVVSDLKTGKELSRKELVVDLSFKGPVTGILSKIALEKYDEDHVYCIINAYYIFKFDKSERQFKPLDNTFFSSRPEFEDGISSMSFGHRGDLYITNGLGKKYSYFFISDKLYPYDKRYKIHDEVLKAPKSVYGYQFTRESTDFPEEPKQLIQFKYQTQAGYPLEDPLFGWRKDFGGSGIFTERSPYKKVLINPYQKTKSRISSFKDLTPGRKYVISRVLISDDEGVLIALKQSVNSKETFTIQKLSAIDGSILWTKKTDWEAIRLFTQMNDYYIGLLEDHNTYIVFNKQLEEVNRFEPKKIEFYIDE